jgi:hypothetical protein
MDYEKIVRYVDGEMNQQEMLEFEVEIKANKSLSDEVTLISGLKKEMRQTEEDSATVETIKELTEKHFPQKTKGKMVSIRWWKYIAAAAAVSGVMIGVRWLMKPADSSDQLIASYSSFEPLSLTMRGGDDDTLVKIELFYNNQQFDSARAWLGAYNKFRQESEWNIIEARSFIVQRRWLEALPILKIVIDGQSAFTSEALLLAGVCHINTLSYNDAIASFQKIPDDDPLSSKAKDLLASIRDKIQ